jgi:enolase-phosphatase E1
VTPIVLLDIEGTIGDIAFVHDVLFPYARARMAQTLESGWQETRVQDAVAQARNESGLALAAPGEATALFLIWMDEDRKITSLKALQGAIWREGYESGALTAHLYPDAVEAFRFWKSQGAKLYIYSSGSAPAQKLYLAHSTAGDLTDLFDGYFDTTTGAKTEAASYAAIAKAIGAPPPEIVFYSDLPREVQAAHSAGMRAVRIDRAREPDFIDQDADGQVWGSFKPVLL